MCLGIPGQISAIKDESRMSAIAEISGVRREVNIACIAPEGGAEALIGKWALIHAGFAMSLVDEEEAAKTLAALHELGETEEALDAMQASEAALGAAQ